MGRRCRLSRMATQRVGALYAATAPNLLGGYNILVPVLSRDPVPVPKIPSNVAIGDCVSAMTTSGANGFIVFGNPAPSDQAAEIKVMAESYQSLVIQVYDPVAPSPPATLKGPWINLPHAEVWVGLNTYGARTRLPANELTQIGGDLNGKVYTGAGKKDALPAVERWQARDGAGRPVVVMRLTWPNENEFLYGMAIVYSQAEGGKRARLVATTGIVKNSPLYVPDIMSLSNGDIDPQPGNCRVRNGLLSLGS
jgi:hypothetical protein